MKKLLILCTGNSCRSQIAEGYFRHYAGNSIIVYSAGIETHGVNPNAIKTMLEDDIDISGQTSNHVDEYKNIDFDYIITVCDHANEKCPFFSSNATRYHHNFPDPAKAVGEIEDIDKAFAKTRDLIKNYVREFIRTEIKNGLAF